MLSISGHKLSGPQGVGALILKKKRYKLPPIKAVTYGGQQEHGIRPGTIPVALVAGLGKACELAEMEYESNIKSYEVNKEAVLRLVQDSGLKYEINGSQNYCMPNTLNISFKGVESEALMLSSKQYCGISNGSACTSHDYSPSYVLTAMGLDADRISSAIRISWGAKTNTNELVNQLAKLIEVARRLCR
jgi:cysteine desulfurase